MRLIIVIITSPLNIVEITIWPDHLGSEFFLMARPSHDVFLLTLIDHGGSILHITLLYDLCDGLTILT